MTEAQLEYLNDPARTLQEKYFALTGDNTDIMKVLEHGTAEQKRWIANMIPGGAAMGGIDVTSIKTAIESYTGSSASASAKVTTYYKSVEDTVTYSWSNAKDTPTTGADYGNTVETQPAATAGGHYKTVKTAATEATYNYYDAVENDDNTGYKWKQVENPTNKDEYGNPVETAPEAKANGHYKTVKTAATEATYNYYDAITTTTYKWEDATDLTDDEKKNAVTITNINDNPASAGLFGKVER